MKSLLRQRHPLALPEKQVELLSESAAQLADFEERLRAFGFTGLHAEGIHVLQVNLGKQCNQTCKHCHVDAGPDRKEMMSRATLEQCLKVIADHNIACVDITGGAPEMHPEFRWFVECCAALRREVIVRCNLTIILANPKYYDLPDFFKRNRVQVVSSLPFYNADRTDRQRGDGVFAKSLEALRRLNAAGYGMDDSHLRLNLVYNPSGAFLPADQPGIERQFREHLLAEHGIHFNSLYAITNMPISRFLDYLVRSGNFEAYMEKLVNAFNPSAVANVMCRNTLSVSWDGRLFDCDFNQMLDLPVAQEASNDIFEFDYGALCKRRITVNQHCFGCTAGAGSSCGGATT